MVSILLINCTILQLLKLLLTWLIAVEIIEMLSLSAIEATEEEYFPPVNNCKVKFHFSSVRTNNLITTKTHIYFYDGNFDEWLTG